MKGPFLAVALLVSACGVVTPPKTPAQALVEARAGLGATVAAFNVYASQRPFCGDVGAKTPPLCADRVVVIAGAREAHQVASALDLAEATINAVDLPDTQWQALAEPLVLLKNLQIFVAGARGE